MGGASSFFRRIEQILDVRRPWRRMSSFSYSYRASALAGVCFALCLASSLCAQAPLQQPVPQPGAAPSAPRRTVVLNNQQPGQQGFSANPIAVLSRNFLVTLVVKNGETSESVEVLTASPTLSFNSVLGKSPSIVVTFSGTLQESEDGSLVLQYGVGGRIPEVVESAAPFRPGSDTPAVATRIEYKDETSSGAIHVAPGTEQMLLKSGQRAYSIRIVPAPKSS